MKQLLLTIPLTYFITAQRCQISLNKFIYERDAIAAKEREKDRIDIKDEANFEERDEFEMVAVNDIDTNTLKFGSPGIQDFLSIIKIAELQEVLSHVVLARPCSGSTPY